MTKIAFIGLGNMGGPMAQNLVKAGYDVCGFDLVPEALDQLAQAGGSKAGSMREAAQGARVVISMLPAGKHVESLYLGDDGLFNIIDRSSLVIDCSTIEAEVAKKVGERAEEQGISFIDAPVSGGTAGAAAGTLTFMVGGSAGIVEQARPYLEVMGQNIFHAGGAGAGQLAKICNNMLLAVLMTGTSEALKLGIDNGLDPAVLAEIMNKSSGGNWVLEKYNPVPGVMPEAPASNGYQGGFMVGLMAKDLGLALNTAAGSKTATPMASLADNLYKMHAIRTGSTKDFSSIIQLYDPVN
ncbi:3-hydroxyisobutyrate dehydrogenase [Endozoicomonas sp. SCSIO W0465]|uniref:3-hydroxyisobutyrate dehydrogenase n=1 Tax=Endozoicomonas sp. SCSIO W0465 TaxID=2918516 RepID=UPI002074E5AC|nr:3-hydroxyisobutyrate dehydrogenase [Endozoicomonas sp. SCSIO W0465]USE33952.1 3-hydroxyisobutyrate dehydrogenase [Endozoicomonas sp. SCSIO W0465]